MPSHGGVTIAKPRPEEVPNGSKRVSQSLEQLKGKYQSVLSLMTQQSIQVQNVHIQDGKLFIRGTAPSQEAKNRVWDQIKLIDPNYSDLTADITVSETTGTASGRVQTAGAGIGGGQQNRTYTVRAGDTLSKISREFYGDANQYMKIFEANRDRLKDPDKIRPGNRHPLMVYPAMRMRRKAAADS